MLRDRENISKKIRFEIFKFDSFTCQYCGKKPPEHSIFVIDHINPIALEGTNSVYNLITACEDCNSGKSDILLEDMVNLESRAEKMKTIKFLEKTAEMVFKEKVILVKESGVIQFLKRIKKFKLIEIDFVDNEVLLLAEILVRKFGTSDKAYNPIYWMYRRLQKKKIHKFLTKKEMCLFLLDKTYNYEKIKKQYDEDEDEEWYKIRVINP